VTPGTTFPPEAPIVQNGWLTEPVPLFEQLGFDWSTNSVVGAARTAELAAASDTPATIAAQMKRRARRSALVLRRRESVLLGDRTPCSFPL